MNAVGESTATVGEYLYRGDAEVARALLASQGIESYVKAEDEGGLNPGFFSDYRVVLVVDAQQVGEARAALGLGESLFVPGEASATMLAHSRWAQPNEACGLLAGTDDAVEMVFCLSNRAASPTRYVIDPREHHGAMRYAERAGWSIVGAWHSHPGGDAVPSRTDVIEAPGGTWITMIVGTAASGADIRAYRTHGYSVQELAVYSELPAGSTRLA